MGSQLAREAAESAARANQQIATCGPRLAELAARLRARPPAVIVTCARGSSDHAATFGKYLLETTLGRIVASVGPSVAPGLDGALVLAVSQSGRSPDLVRFARRARAGGALVVGLVNEESSPLAAACELVIPLCAGEERGIAATKSFLLAGLAFLQIAAIWGERAELHDAVAHAPDALAAAAALDWAPALLPLTTTASSLYVLGRGLGLGAAQELALKLKETCRIHAEAFSTAEVLHGPIALVGAGFPILALGHDPQAAATLAQLDALGAVIQLLPTVAGISPLLAPLCQVQSFYLALPALAAARGLDADAPRSLHKITETT